MFSPVQTDEQYVASDGLPLSIPGMEFRNLVVVVSEEGGEGVLIGQALNPAFTPVQARFGVEGGAEPEIITIPPREGDGISAVPSQVDIGPVPARPGGMVEVVVSTQEAGKNLVRVPVLPPEGIYEGIVPGTSPSP